MFDISDYSVKSKYYDDSNELVLDEMKDEKGGVAIEKTHWVKAQDILVFDRWW